jgi:hypothetical protein
MPVINTCRRSRLELSLFVVSLALLGNSPPNDIPAALQPYVVDGVLKSDDFGWMRGAFDGASEQQKADLEAIKVWLMNCKATAKAKAIDDLKDVGATDPKLDIAPSGSELCGSIANYIPMSEPTNNWDEFLSNEAQARTIFAVYELGAETARQFSAYEPNWGIEESWDLLAATMMEQVYRKGMGWSGRKDYPKIDAKLEPYLNAHMGNAAQKADRKNTGMLKAIVEKKGWPSISLVGEQAASNAWLLVQHADNDPAFQLKSLRLMEPLAAKGDVSKSNYAYLYDRITLQLSGKQRFGTQFGGCDGPEYKLRPLEHEAQLDRLRKEHDLEPISDYRKSMKDTFGPCRAN